LLILAVLFFLLSASFLFFSVVGVFSLVYFQLSVPVQMIAWKDLSPKWPVMHRVECTTTYS